MAISVATATFQPTRAIGLSSSAASPKALGNCWVLTTQVQTTAVSATGVTGGGVTTWTRLVGPFAAEGGNLDIWLGPVTALGSSPINVAGISGSGVNNMLMLTEFTNGSGAGTTWAKDGTQSATTTVSTAVSGTMTFPLLSPAAIGEMYFGYSQVSGSATTAVQTSGYTTVLDTAVNPMIYGNVTALGSQAPKATLSGSNTYGAAGALITATAPATVLPGQFFPLLSHHEPESWGLPRRRIHIDLASPRALTV